VTQWWRVIKQKSGVPSHSHPVTTGWQRDLWIFKPIQRFLRSYRERRPLEQVQRDFWSSDHPVV